MKLYSVSLTAFDAELPVFVDEQGYATNRYVDGTVGVPLDQQANAEENWCPDDDGMAFQSFPTVEAAEAFRLQLRAQDVDAVRLTVRL